MKNVGGDSWLCSNELNEPMKQFYYAAMRYANSLLSPVGDRRCYRIFPFYFYPYAIIRIIFR